MRKLAILAVLVVMCAGCSAFPIKKHLVIEGEGIITPYGRGDKIKITRDVCFGAKCDASVVTPVVDTTVK